MTHFAMQKLYSSEDLERLAVEMGFLPFFKNEIGGFSIEEHTPSERWFSDENEGPWDWKGSVARNGKCVYGKFFKGKAGFVSMEWFPELVNYRRHCYEEANRSSNNLLEVNDKPIYDAVVAHESLLSKEIKLLLGFGEDRKPHHLEARLVEELDKKPKATRRSGGYDTIMTRLQMATYLIIVDFEYLLDKYNQPYGWGIARYTTPELLIGKSLILSCSHHTAEESFHRLQDYLSHLLPQASETQINHIIDWK
jgi:hypothetical protein